MIKPLPDHIKIHSVTPDLNFAAIDTVITVPTFKRPEQLLQTLHSLNEQKTDKNFAIIVIENDSPDEQGAKAAGPLFLEKNFTGMVIVEEQAGNCNAYNAGWLTALHYFPNFEQILVIDDDEIASQHWVEELCKTQKHFKSDLVGGPQIPVFNKTQSHNWAKHPVFAPPYNITGPVPILYSSGNLLIKRRVIDAMPFPFLEPMFNFTGGGDADFIDRSRRKGFTTAWSNEAQLFETVPARRLEADWIRTRAMRNGMISTMVERRRRAHQPFGRFINFGRSLAILAFSPVKALIKGLQTQSLSIGLNYIYVGFGRFMAHFGYEYEQYRAPEKN